MTYKEYVNFPKKKKKKKKKNFSPKHGGGGGNRWGKKFKFWMDPFFP